jgi:hypothetical protein
MLDIGNLMLFTALLTNICRLLFLARILKRKTFLLMSFQAMNRGKETKIKLGTSATQYTVI